MQDSGSHKVLFQEIISGSYRVGVTIGISILSVTLIHDFQYGHGNRYDLSF